MRLLAPVAHFAETCDQCESQRAVGFVTAPSGCLCSCLRVWDSESGWHLGALLCGFTFFLRRKRSSLRSKHMYFGLLRTSIEWTTPASLVNIPLRKNRVFGPSLVLYCWEPGKGCWAHQGRVQCGQWPVPFGIVVGPWVGCGAGGWVWMIKWREAAGQGHCRAAGSLQGLRGGGTDAQRSCTCRLDDPGKGTAPSPEL